MLPSASRAGPGPAAPSSVFWIAGTGALAGFVEVQGPPLVRACLAAALGAALAAALALRADHLTKWWAVLSIALVVAISALSRTDWALAPRAPLKERLLFAVATLAVGARLLLRPFERNGRIPTS